MMTKFKISFCAGLLFCLLVPVVGNGATVAALNGMEDDSRVVGRAINAAYTTLDKERAKPQQAGEAERKAAFKLAATALAQWISKYLEHRNAYRHSTALKARYIHSLLQLGVCNEFSGDTDQAFDIYNKAKSVDALV